MEILSIIFWLYCFFSGVIGGFLGVGCALNGDSLYTPKMLTEKIKNMNQIKIYHIFFIFGILAAIVYYIWFGITTLCLKIGKTTIYTKRNDTNEPYRRSQRF